MKKLPALVLMATSIINKMKTKLTILTAILLILIGGLGSCREKEEPYIEEEEEETNFCSYLNVKDIDKTIPFINEFLSSLPINQSAYRTTMLLLDWLNSQPCIDSAVFRFLESTLLFSFTENGTTKSFSVHISEDFPWEVVEFHEFKQPAGYDFCLFVNEKDISKTIPIINEYLKWHFLWFSEVARMPQDLAAWLKSKPCILDATVVDPEVGVAGRIHFSFDANGTVKEYDIIILDYPPWEVLFHGFYNPTPSPIPLYGTAWKLVGIVDAETGALRVLEPIPHWNSYTIFFYGNTIPNELPFGFNVFFRHPPPTGMYKALGVTRINHVAYFYGFNSDTGNFRIHRYISTSVLDPPEGRLYSEILDSVHSFSLQDNTLKLYYDDKQNYLLYKPWSP